MLLAACGATEGTAASLSRSAALRQGATDVRPGQGTVGQKPGTQDRVERRGKRVAGCCAEQSSAPPLNRFSSSSVTLQAMVKFSLAMSLIGLRHAAGSTQRISGRTEGCHWRWRTALVCSASMRQGIRGVPCLEPDHGQPGWGTGILQARE